MSDQETVAYGVAIGRMIAARGEATREQALTALGAFGLTRDQANTVLADGLAHDLFWENPETGKLNASPMAVQTAPQATAPPADVDTSRRLMLLRFLVATLPIVMWAFDREGRFIYYEGKGLRKAGLPDGAFVGQLIHEIVSFDHPAAVHYKRALAGEVVHGIWEYGGVVWENWGFPIHNVTGEVGLVALASLDITDAARTEQDLRAKLETIERQQRVINELSTPIIEIWDKVLALPLLGVVDSSRAAEVMTALLAEVVGKGARFVLLDLTGVEAVDTATASHMLSLIHAVRLLGAEGIITGIRPSVAQTMVTLGVGLDGIVTHSNLRQGLQYCLGALQPRRR